VKEKAEQYPIKCSTCGQANKESAKACRKCGADMTLPPAWFPDWKWHAKALGVIYVGLTIIFFAAKHFLGKLPPPFHQRELPPQMTPWLHPDKAEAP
jgi:hypothetical protein